MVLTYIYRMVVVPLLIDSQLKTQHASSAEKQLLVPQLKLGEENLNGYLKQEGEYRGDKRQLCEQEKEKEEEEEEHGAVGLCDRLMLVSSLFSIEMCMSFQQLYEILL
ncbi:hypothetical protein ElyMa_006606000 [Elysia marginata]|uniref:Uncharacterized protein n=1 Tax=Elysia marginata TaxID=1093978 RepID=A0AAV4IG17_9GAST|nr:hypothetical protein ElyMa_006606000 [Elysia marginata]